MSTLNVGGTMGVGEGLVSDSGSYWLSMQADNNLVVYESGGTAIWASNTDTPDSEDSTSTCILQEDGNLVVYRNGEPTWASNTDLQTVTHLIMRDDGNLVLYNDTDPIWATNTVGGSGGTVQGWGGGESDSAQRILDYINQYRANHHAPPVTWNEDCADFARNWAETMLAEGFHHSGGGGKYGENLYQMSGSGGLSGKTLDNSYDDQVAAVDAWYNEVSLYDYNNPVFGLDTGHFTALVWAGTAEMGIGIASDDSTVNVVLSTYPPGNYEGQFAENVLPP